VLFGFRRYGFYSIVFGYVAGHVIQLGIFAIHLAMNFPVRYSLSIEGSGEAFRNLRGAGAAQMTSALGRQGLVVVERIIASYLPPGTLTALGYGMKIMATLAELLAGSVGTAALPTISQAFARDESEEVRRGLRHAIEIGLLLTAPAAVFCLALSPNIIRLIFERGNFTAQATALMGRIFLYYSLSLFLYAALRLLNVYLFARNEAMAFLRLAAFQIPLNIILDLLFVGVFHWFAAGIPLAMLTSMSAACAVAYVRDLGNLRESLNRALGEYALKILLASGLAAVVAVALGGGLAAPRTGVANFLFLCETCGAGTFAFFAALLALRAVKFSQIVSLWRRTETS
jgi:putative peptidoglycan lipid II flippase